MLHLQEFPGSMRGKLQVAVVFSISRGAEVYIQLNLKTGVPTKT